MSLVSSGTRVLLHPPLLSPLPPPLLHRIVTALSAINMSVLGVIKQLPRALTSPHTRIRECVDLFRLSSRRGTDLSRDVHLSFSPAGVTVQGRFSFPFSLLDS